MKNQIIIFVFIFISYLGYSQEAQFTQFYSTALNLNPAFAGGIDRQRIALDYRSQWSSVGNAYSTVFAGYDFNIEKTNGGAGFYIKNDNLYSSAINKLEIAPIYAQQIDINEDFKLRLAIKPSYSFWSINNGALLYGDQISNNGKISTQSSEMSQKASIHQFGLGAGMLAYSREFWLGFSANNIVGINQNKYYSPLFMSIHGGYKKEIDDIRSISPVFQFRKQSQFIQLDLGLYYEVSPMVFGIWYRGIPVVNKVKNIINQDALCFLIGYKWEQITFAYSYDLPLNSLISTLGSHEISLIWLLGNNNPKKPKPRGYQLRLPCPKF